MLSDRELQKAASRALCERLAARGDARTIVREIDHWAYFPTPESRASFVEAGIRVGFRLRGTSEPTGLWQGYGAQLYHHDIPSDDAMEQITLLLYDLAEEAGGDYDGWETRILT